MFTLVVNGMVIHGRQAKVSSLMLRPQASLAMFAYNSTDRSQLHDATYRHSYTSKRDAGWPSLVIHIAVSNGLMGKPSFV
jgi:hypothetical protein